MDRLTGYLVAARDGDDLALTAAIRAGQPEVRRFLRVLVDPSDLDDVVQDTFVRAYRALPRFRGDSSGRTWLLAIARRAAADATRRRVRQRRTRERAEVLVGGLATADPAAEHALTDLVADLEPERREAFVLTQLVGCPYVEAAEICGVPVGTIRSRVARAREQLLEQVRGGALRMTRRARRALATFGIGIALVIAAASPAGAHGTSGPPASNFRPVVAGVTPATPGVTARLGADGERVELRVTGPDRVTVLGYRGEPYLRVSRAGVFENRASPAVALNRTRVPSGAAPRGPIGPPRWVRVSDSSTARWHDHRAHWMGGATPEPVRRDPDHPHVIERWRIPLRVGTAAAAITGQVRWDPPPDAALWFGLAAVFAIAVLAGVAIAARPAFLVALTILAVTESLHLWGGWPFSTATTVGRVGENLPSIAAVAMALVALVWLARRSVYSAAPLLILAGLFAAVAGGFADLPLLSHAWIPSRLDPTLARTFVAVALGVGSGVAIGGALRLRAPRPTS